MELRQRLQDTMRKLLRGSPDWVFAIAQMLYWAFSSKYPSILLIPAGHRWMAVRKGDKLYVPSPRTAILAHFIGGYERVYERYFQVEKDDTVLDVGAYVGSFSIVVAKRAKRVLAIEPDPQSYACLKENILYLNNVQAVNKAVWKTETKLKLSRNPRSPIENSLVLHVGSEFVEVETETLDKIVSDAGLDRIDFIKMNIEGAELEAFEGADRALSLTKKVVMDVHHFRDGEPTKFRVMEFLGARGFETRVEEGTLYAWRK